MRLPPLGSEFILRKRHANPTEYNSSLSYYLQFGAPADAKLRNTAALIHHIMREDAVRTRAWGLSARPDNETRVEKEKTSADKPARVVTWMVSWTAAAPRV